MGFDCDAEVAAVDGGAQSCVDAVKGEAQSVIENVYYVIGAVILYEIAMMAFTVSFLYGLRNKKAKMKDLMPGENMKSPSTATPGLRRIDSDEYKKTKMFL